MQLILKDNYIHLIVSPDDLKRFKKYQEVEESVVFGPSFGDKIVFSLKTNHSYERLHVSLIANELAVHAPKNLINEWLRSEIDSFHTQINIGEGRDLVIRVSKDPLLEVENFLRSRELKEEDPKNITQRSIKEEWEDHFDLPSSDT
ncbi:MAG: hypothetical protein MRZ79_03855 [Bacteroidia bacterium]|nr:hypothetical protein [Bacteroidia bacterium]